MTQDTSPAQRLPPAEPSPCVLRVAQLNCNRQATVAPDLARYMASQKVQIALLQEFHRLPTGFPSGFPRGMRTFRGAVGRRMNMAAVVINADDIEANQWDNLTS